MNLRSFVLALFVTAAAAEPKGRIVYSYKTQREGPSKYLHIREGVGLRDQVVSARASFPGT